MKHRPFHCLLFMALLACSVLSTQALVAQEPSPLPDMKGKWAQMQVTRSITDVPLVGDIRSRTTSLLMFDVSQDGADLKFTEQLCHVHVESESSQLRTIIPQGFLKAMSGIARKATLIRTGDGWSYRQHRNLVVGGAKLKRPSKDNLPEDEDDPRLQDADRDGKPGLTVMLRGLIDGEVYVVQRGWNKLMGTFTATGTISGLITWRLEQRVVDASSMFLNSSPETKPDPNKKLHTFKMIRIPESMTCGTLRRQQSKLF